MKCVGGSVTVTWQSFRLLTVTCRLLVTGGVMGRQGGKKKRAAWTTRDLLHGNNVGGLLDAVRQLCDARFAVCGLVFMDNALAGSFIKHP